MRVWRRAANIGVVVHGPEVVDSGSALRLINYLKRFGNVTAVLGGTMGRLAIIDAGLENVIAISADRRPSKSLRNLQGSSDFLVLVCQSKTRETGLDFGSTVASNARVTKPLIQIDCGGRFVASLNESEEDDGELAKVMANDLGLELQGPAVRVIQSSSGVVHEGDIIKRRLIGVMPGELITVNGVVVAKATDSFVEIEAQGGRIIRIKGAEPKAHGIEKLPPVDLERAIIRSGNIRRTEAVPRPLECKGDLAVLINHSAEDAFEIAKDACVAVTVGDDTTAISGEILSRLSVPVIGIVDGDLDRLADTNNMPKGSMVIRVMPGYDDVIGRQVKEEIFKGGNRAQIKASDLANRVMEIAGEYVVHIEML